MNRRDFVSASLGSLGALGASWAHGQAPSCPPPLIDAGGEPVSTGCGAGQQLAQVAAGLSAGQSVNFSSGPSWVAADSVTWQTATVYYDATRKHVHAVGKVASINPYEHYIYNEATNSWGGNTLSSSTFGHMWATAFDPAEGAYYYAENGDADGIKRYVSGSGWTDISNSPTSGYVAGIGWHPNLYGTGDGGLVVVANTLTLAWRRSTNIWSTLQSSQQDAGYNGGSGAWDSVNNRVWVGTGNSVRAAIVTAGSGGTVGTASTPADPPLQIAGNGEGSGTNKVIPHPYTAGKLLLLASDSGTVYQSTNSGATWSNAGYMHPFVVGGGQWTCGPIAAYGVVWGLSSPGRGGMSRIWKPPA